MRYLSVILLLGVAFGAGYLTRGWVDPKPAPRTDRQPVDLTLARGADVTVTDSGPAGAGKPAGGEPPAAGWTVDVGEAKATPQKEGEGEAEAAGQDAEADDPIVEMIKSQAPQWKAWAGMQAKPKIENLLTELGFDEATSKRIEEALLADVERQVDRAIAMMLGEADMDPDAFSYFMGLPADLSPDLERELGAFLSDAEIATVRDHVKKENKKQMEAMVDMQISMMAIPDLDQDQKRRVREVFAGRDVMREQFTQFAEVSRDRGILKKLVSGEIDLAVEMKKGFAPQRERMRTILTPEQFKKYEAYEESLVRQAQMGLKMMGSMLKQSGAK